jgi:hypothetical protein
VRDGLPSLSSFDRERDRRQGSLSDENQLLRRSDDYDCFLVGEVEMMGWKTVNDGVENRVRTLSRRQRIRAS